MSWERGSGAVEAGGTGSSFGGTYFVPATVPESGSMCLLSPQPQRDTELAAMRPQQVPVHGHHVQHKSSEVT